MKSLIYSLGTLVIFFSTASIAKVESALPGLLTVDAHYVKWEGRPRDPAVAPNGQVWFCGQSENYIARLDPETGAMKKYQVPEGSNPHNLIIDSKGFIWYAGNKNGHIGKLNPETGEVQRFDMPEPIKDPHTLVFDAEQNIWFTAQWSNAIGHLNIKTGKVRYLVASKAKSRPYGIKLDEQGKPWIVMVGTNRIATVDTETFTLHEIDLPNENARPRRLQVLNNDVWFVDYATGQLGRYSPEKGRFNFWLLPHGESSKPYGTALDKHNNLWIAETGIYPNYIVGFDTQREAFFSSNKLKQGGSVRYMHYDKKSDKFWFGVDTGFIASAELK